MADITRKITANRFNIPLDKDHKQMLYFIQSWKRNIIYKNAGICVNAPGMNVAKGHSHECLVSFLEKIDNNRTHKRIQISKAKITHQIENNRKIDWNEIGRNKLNYQRYCTNKNGLTSNFNTKKRWKK